MKQKISGQSTNAKIKWITATRIWLLQRGELNVAESLWLEWSATRLLELRKASDLLDSIL